MTSVRAGAPAAPSPRLLPQRAPLPDRATLQRIADTLLEHPAPDPGDEHPLIVDGRRIGTVRPLRHDVLRHVDRIELSRYRSLLWKRLTGPLRAETRTLTALQPTHRSPGPTAAPRAAVGPGLLLVPTVLAVAHGILADGLLLDNLGTSRPLPANAWPTTVRAIHAQPAPPGLAIVDEAHLASLPARALAHLDALRADGVGRWTSSDRIAADLDYLRRLGQHRSSGATLGPFSLCHGNLTADALHATPDGTVFVLGWGHAFHGPGLLDLLGSVPLGSDGVADAFDSHDEILDAYLDLGGDPAAGHDRGDLPAPQWAAGWSRMLHAERLLGTAAAWLDEPADAAVQHEVGVLLAEAVQCLR